MRYNRRKWKRFDWLKRVGTVPSCSKGSWWIKYVQLNASVWALIYSDFNKGVYVSQIYFPNRNHIVNISTMTGRTHDASMLWRPSVTHKHGILLTAVPGRITWLSRMWMSIIGGEITSWNYLLEQGQGNAICVLLALHVTLLKRHIITSLRGCY